MHEDYKRILIVDDEIMILKVLRRFLQNDKYITFEAESAEKALELFRDNQPFYALLCDINLGSIGGKELAERIHRFQPSIHVIILTGASQYDLPKIDFKHMVLFKPFSRVDLRKKFEDLASND